MAAPQPSPTENVLSYGASLNREPRTQLSPSTAPGSLSPIRSRAWPWRNLTLMAADTDSSNPLKPSLRCSSPSLVLGPRLLTHERERGSAPTSSPLRTQRASAYSLLKAGALSLVDGHRLTFPGSLASCGMKDKPFVIHKALDLLAQPVPLPCPTLCSCTSSPLHSFTHFVLCT